MDVIVIGINEESEVASVLTEENLQIGVNLWQVKGYKRRFDGYYTDEYVPV